jgi:hypothetical protein
MQHHDAACLDSFKRINDFKTANAADFTGADPASVKATALFGEMSTVVSGLSAATGGQVGGSGAARSGATSKAGLRDMVLGTMRGINKSAAAIALAQKNPSILDNFRLADGHNDTELAARAMAFGNAATPLQSSFVELGHATTFVQDLADQVTAFNAADESKNTGAQARSGATASIDPLIHQGITVSKQLDAIMHNKFAGNAAKLGAWATASHVERRSSPPNAQPQPAAAAHATA